MRSSRRTDNLTCAERAIAFIYVEISHDPVNDKRKGTRSDNGWRQTSSIDVSPFELETQL